MQVSSGSILPFDLIIDSRYSNYPVSCIIILSLVIFISSRFLSITITLSLATLRFISYFFIPLFNRLVCFCSSFSIFPNITISSLYIISVTNICFRFPTPSLEHTFHFQHLLAISSIIVMNSMALRTPHCLIPLEVLNTLVHLLRILIMFLVHAYILLTAPSNVLFIPLF